jgi:hypothetical protein
MPQEMPCPAPSAANGTRPGLPVSLAALISGTDGSPNGSPFSVLGTGTPALRKVAQKPLFEVGTVPPSQSPGDWFLAQLTVAAPRRYSTIQYFSSARRRSR